MNKHVANYTRRTEYVGLTQNKLAIICHFDWLLKGQIRESRGRRGESIVPKVRAIFRRWRARHWLIHAAAHAHNIHMASVSSPAQVCEYPRVDCAHTAMCYDSKVGACCMHILYFPSFVIFYLSCCTHHFYFFLAFVLFFSQIQQIELKLFFSLWRDHRCVSSYECWRTQTSDCKADLFFSGFNNRNTSLCI